MKFIIHLIACGLLCSCSMLNVSKVHDSFAGLKGLYEANTTTSVIVVHGMGDHPPGYSKAMQGGIMQRLDASATTAKSVTFDLQLNGYPLGVVTRTVFTSLTSGKRVVFVELEWSDATRPIKRTLLDLTEDDRENGFLQEHRLRFNSEGKSFVNTHLSDPLIYSGAFGEVLRGATGTAICIMLRGDKSADLKTCTFDDIHGSSGEFAIISSSMGSSLVFDTVSRLWKGTEQERAASRAFLQRAKRIYMFANQIPLLELREVGDVTGPDWLSAYPCPDTPPSSATAGVGSGLRDFLILRRGVGSTEEALNPSLALDVVAFSDPNDLLTYGLSKRFKANCKPARFANVTVTNAKTGWLFIGANPVQAHVDYDVNDQVLDLLVNGGAPTN